MKSKYRKGIFVVVFSGERYLVLHRILHWNGWEFPKGGIEKGEVDESTIRREIKEETGLKARRIIDLKFSGKFNYGRELPDRPGMGGQTFKLFAVEVDKNKVKLDKREHTGYKWMSFKEAEKQLTWSIQKRCLKKVEKFRKKLK